MSEAAPRPSHGQPERVGPAAPSLVADVNEPTDLLDLLRERGVVVDRRRLAPADFIVGRLAIERKSVGDFHASMIDKRLFEQMGRLRETYEDRVALLLEGDLSFFEERKQPKASWGALAAIAVGMGVAILPTSSKEATADLLTVLARRAARESAAAEAAAPSGGDGDGGTGGARVGGTRHDVRFKPRMPGVSAEQRFAVQGLPGIGDVVSESLLEHFGSVRRVYAVSERELLRVPGIGKGRAKEIAAFLDRPYRGRQGRLVADEAGSSRPLEGA